MKRVLSNTKMHLFDAKRDQDKEIKRLRVLSKPNKINFTFSLQKSNVAFAGD